MAGIEIAEIGFSGGQVIIVRLETAKLKQLRKALEGADGWADLETPTGIVSVDLAQIVFVRTDAPAQTVGFSG